MNKILHIQGDIRIIKIEKLPENAKKRKENILVYGEATGHAHRVSGGEVYELGERVFLQTYTSIDIYHEEHDTIPLEMPGLYEIKRQREYQSRDMVRLVID